MASFRFLHAADIHLDSPLRGLARYEGLPVDRLRRATRDAFDNLIELAISEGVDFVVIAGDVFDGEWRDMSTGLYFAGAMGRLSEAGIPVFLLKGNHDAESLVAKSLPLPSSVKTFSSRKAETFDLPELGVALHGRSFPTAHVTEDLAQGYPAPTPGRFNIGVLHTALSGYAQHAPYAPCTIQALASKGYGYWALGHVHEHEVLSQDPWIVYPGNLQGRHARELGAKGAVVVEVVDGEVSSVRHEPLDVLRWARVSIDCTGVSSVTETHGRIAGALAQLREDNPQSHGLVARVILGGSTAAAGALSDGRALLREEIRALAQAKEDLWIEKVVIETTTPLTETASAIEDAASLLDEAIGDPELAELLASDLKPFLDAAPTEIYEAGSLQDAARQGRWNDLLSAASIALRERLATGSQ